MYQIVHGPAACEAVERSVPDPPQALSVLPPLFFQNFSAFRVRWTT